jgi:hypothetical protein
VPVAYLYCDDDELAHFLVALHRAPSVTRRQLMRQMLLQLER